MDRRTESAFNKSFFEGEVRIAKEMPFIIRSEDNESFNAWLCKHAGDWEGKKVRIVIRLLESCEKQ